MRWRCTVCGEEHDGLPLDWGFIAPKQWDGGKSDDDWLTEDLCVWTDDAGNPAYFIRGVLQVPVTGLNDTLNWGVWSSLSKSSFDRVLELWDDPARTAEPPYFGWLSNWIAGYPDTVNLPLDVVTAELDRRPKFLLHDGDHPLVADQRGGITLDRVLDHVGPRLHEVALDG